MNTSSSYRFEVTGFRLRPITYMYTAISINVVGSKLQAKRQDRKVVWVVLNLSSEARQGR